MLVGSPRVPPSDQTLNASQNAGRERPVSDEAGRPPLSHPPGGDGHARCAARANSGQPAVRGRLRWPVLLVLLLALGGCASALDSFEDFAERIGLDDRESVLDVYLIGDAGDPAPEGDPVLLAAEAAIRQGDPARTLVVYLGDNVYPEGLSTDPGPDRDRGEDILRAQLAVASRTGARGIVLPGNHDWDHSGPEGLAEVRAQAAFVEAEPGNVAFLPRDGCPGPVVEDVGPLRLVILDTQWWLHAHEKPGPGDGCPTSTQDEVTEAMRLAFREAGDRPVVVLAHHPLVSVGAHGVLPLFPERYTPRPAFDPQDLGHSRNRTLRRELRRAMADHTPLLYAAGHDHSLQVLSGGGARFTAVSGAGFYGHTSPVRKFSGTLYAARASGYMRLRMLEDGAVRLEVFEVDEQGRADRAFSRVLTRGRRGRAPSLQPVTSGQTP